MLTRAWRTRAQRLRLDGFKITHQDGSIDYEFPPKNNREKPIEVYNCKIEAQNSSLLLPNDQVIHSEIVRQDQEQDNKS